TAYAQPHLGCPEWAEAIYQSQLPGIGEAEANRLREQAAKACRDRLLAEGIDLNGYHTREIAADIEDLRRLLELDQINLLTISYSTKIAQVLLRDYPEHIRSVVMDSALPLEVSYDEESVANALATTRELLSDCAQDAACGAAYPDLGNRFFTYLEEITRQPLEVQVTHPEEGTLETFSVQGQDIFNMVISAGTEQVPDVPWEIEKLLQGDLSTVKQQLASRLSGPGYADGVGMRLSVWCAEEFPFADSAVMARETRAYPSVTGLSPEVYSASVCAIWGVAPMADLENEPVSSTVPVLFINGQYDEATPSLWAQTMQVRFPNSFHLVFPGWKHTPTTYWSNPCGMAVANAFFNDPTQRPALYCFQELEVSFTQP
ncbi:MAG TPA: hypothetical protein DCR93_11545, partial [Cytophagales bacterium]|nr:hypothetical protein [Cytophagales bacterium]